MLFVIYVISHFALQDLFNYTLIYIIYPAAFVINLFIAFNFSYVHFNIIEFFLRNIYKARAIHLGVKQV